MITSRSRSAQSRQSPVLKWISGYVDLSIALSDARNRAECPPSRRSARPKELADHQPEQADQS
jgi:hypothetical protein